MLSLVETFDRNHRQYTVSFRRLGLYQPFKYPRYAKRVTYSSQLCQKIIYECFISKAPYWILESVYCSFHFGLIKSWRFWFQIYDSNRPFVFRKLKGRDLLCLRDNETYKSDSLQLVRSFIKKCFMQYQIYTIF